MKKILAGVLCLVATYAIIVAGNGNTSSAEWREETIAKERVMALPDCVYEHIINNLGDDASNSQIMEYYYANEMECLEIEAQNELIKH